MSHIRGRFGKEAEQKVVEYTSSIQFDWRLFRQDIAGSMAHARMLARQGIITEAESATIIKALAEIRQEIENGQMPFKPELEDIHMHIESRLLEKVGEVGGKLHTARSRNDQVALDFRLYVRDCITQTHESLRILQHTLVSLAEAHQETLLPGYTHLQPAQPVLFAHHLLAYFEMFQRDYERFGDCLKRVNISPLGSGALAGVAYDIDRASVAEELGFDGITRNSMDAVSDRDFALEYQAGASICMMHISRLAEEIIIWANPGFGFIDLDEAYATGSSIMPQKKNPDVAELARGKTGRVYGRLMALLTTMKGLPLSYNRDLQEDKEGFFDTADTLLSSLEVFAGMLGTMRIRADRMSGAIRDGYLLATDIADYLVGKGVAFRTAHGIVGKLVSYASEQHKGLEELSLEEYCRFSDIFDEDVFAISATSSLSARNNPGGTAPEQVSQAIAEAKRLME